MKILILSFYYTPDLCAGSFRTAALVKALLNELPDTYSIDILTTLPNRYSSYSDEALELEKLPRLNIHRISLPTHKSGMIDQSKAFLTYAKKVIKISSESKYDFVFATSSRLMTAFLGAIISRKIDARLYLDIRDIFLDTISDVLPKKLTFFLNPVFSLIESWTIRSAAKINLVSEGFLPYFEKKYPEKKYSTFTNGIDDIFVDQQPMQISSSQNEILNVLYAGNIGEGQGLHLIIPSLAKTLEGKLAFTVIGDGGRKNQLISALEKAECTNVKLRPPIQRDELLKEYKLADILFLHLNDYEAFKKVLPSKLFEYGALGKPIWAGVSGYAEKFTKTYISNAESFFPCDTAKAIQAFEKLDFRTMPRKEFIDQFSREKIMEKMAIDIKSVAEKM